MIESLTRFNYSLRGKLLPRERRLVTSAKTVKSHGNERVVVPSWWLRSRQSAATNVTGSVWVVRTSRRLVWSRIVRRRRRGSKVPRSSWKFPRSESTERSHGEIFMKFIASPKCLHCSPANDLNFDARSLSSDSRTFLERGPAWYEIYEVSRIPAIMVAAAVISRQRRRCWSLAKISRILHR